MRSLFSLMILALLTLQISCGRSQNNTADSNTKSLVGYPCQNYYRSGNPGSYHCVSVKQSREVDLLFYFDGFQPAQEEVLRNSLNLAFQAYNDYFSNNEPLKQCVKKYTTKDWIPYGGLGKSLATVDQQIAWAMTSTWFNFAWHADTSTVIVINSAYIPSDGSSYTMGRVETIGTDAIANVSSSTYNDVNMNIFINTVAIDSGHYNAHDFAGTIYHEFMHRKGFTHNSGYRGALIKELGLCIARENADESLSLTWKPEMVD